MLGVGEFCSESCESHCLCFVKASSYREPILTLDVSIMQPFYACIKSMYIISYIYEKSKHFEMTVQ